MSVLSAPAGAAPAVQRLRHWSCGGDRWRRAPAAGSRSEPTDAHAQDLLLDERATWSDRLRWVNARMRHNSLLENLSWTVLPYWRFSTFSPEISDKPRPTKEEVFSLRAFLLLLVKQLVVKVGAGLPRRNCHQSRHRSSHKFHFFLPGKRNHGRWIPEYPVVLSHHNGGMARGLSSVITYPDYFLDARAVFSFRVHTVDYLITSQLCSNQK